MWDYKKIDLFTQIHLSFITKYYYLILPNQLQQHQSCQGCHHGPSCLPDDTI